MKNKIIFLSYLPLTKKIQDEFFIEYLIENNYAVEYWDLKKIYYPDLKLSDTIEKSFISEITSLKDFKKQLEIENIKSIVFILYMTYSLKVLKLFRILTKYNATISFINTGQFPKETKDIFQPVFVREKS